MRVTSFVWCDGFTYKRIGDPGMWDVIANSAGVAWVGGAGLVTAVILLAEHVRFAWRAWRDDQAAERVERAALERDWVRR